MLKIDVRFLRTYLVKLSLLRRMLRETLAQFSIDSLLPIKKGSV